MPAKTSAHRGTGLFLTTETVPPLKMTTNHCAGIYRCPPQAVMTSIRKPPAGCSDDENSDDGDGLPIAELAPLQFSDSANLCGKNARCTPMQTRRIAVA